MNTALSWIKAYVPDLDVTDQQYTDAMTLTGTKVEGFERLDKNLEKIVVGQILSIERHPDADKLIVCQVDVGTETVQIVTGAPNVKVGDKGCCFQRYDVLHRGAGIFQGYVSGRAGRGHLYYEGGCAGGR